MYGNVSGGDQTEEISLTPDQRAGLRDDLSALTARTRDLLPGEFVVGSELADGQAGPRARIAVQPPVGHPVSADLEATPEGIDDDRHDEIVTNLAASAALQVKEAMAHDDAPVAQ